MINIQRLWLWSGGWGGAEEPRNQRANRQSLDLLDGHPPGLSLALCRMVEPRESEHHHRGGLIERGSICVTMRVFPEGSSGKTGHRVVGLDRWGSRFVVANALTYATTCDKPCGLAWNLGIRAIVLEGSL